ncbi:MAG: cobalamin biosynthesis protein [Firmicutes bacterium]|nr:cobalamin biosynthesis protein [Bacillota bacterium]
MIVGRDTARLDEKGVARAAVETVAENFSDGVMAPIIYMAVGGPALGFLYKAVNTMDSMTGYIDPPYTYFGFVPAKMDDLFNWIPARVSALVMLLAGRILGLDAKNGWRIFRRDRYNHASPNSAQTESVCAGLLGLQLAGDAWYGGVLHKKQFIGDPVREIETKDIERSCRLMYASAAAGLIIALAARAAIVI